MEKGVPIRAISRGMAVLQAINRGGSLSMMDIAHASEVPYPTACRIVQTLLFEGLIEREPNRKRYRPTALVQTLAHGFQGHGRLVTAARSHIVALTRHVRWPISLTTQVGHSMIIRDSTHSLTSLTFNQYYPGYAMPVLECAAGHVYLAWAGDEERDGILHGLKLMPTAPSAALLRQFSDESFLQAIRDRGYVTRDHNRFTQNPGKTSSIAVPLFDDGTVAGALTLAYFATALGLEEAVRQFVEPLMAATRAISASLRQNSMPPIPKNGLAATLDQVGLVAVTT